MNVALFWKTLRDSRVLLVVVALALVFFEIVFLRAMREMGDDLLAFFTHRPMVARLLKLAIGAEIGEKMSPATLVLLGFIHPFLLACTWAFILATCTRVIAGEIDRGTADLLLSLPLSRSTVYVTVTGVWLLCGLIVSAAPLLGAWLGSRFFHGAALPEMRALWLLIGNLYLLYLAIGALTLLASTFVSRRGHAIAIALGIVLSSILVNFLVDMLKFAEELAWLSLLSYYRPSQVVAAGAIPGRDVLVLTAIFVVSWAIGLWQFSRRDVPAT